MVRTVGDTAELRRALFAAIEAAGAQVALWREVPAVHLGSLPGFATTVVKYTTDVPRLSGWGEPFLLGPGSIHVAHTADERVPKRQLMEAVELYDDLVRRLSHL
jgi:acetylornithine deacetylase